MGKRGFTIQEEEKTEIAYGLDNVLAKAYEVGSLTKFRIDSCTDKLYPIMLITTEPVKQEFLRLVHSGVKSRMIAEITEDNISHIKELIKMAGDNGAFRHLDNIAGNFFISDGKIYHTQITGYLHHLLINTNNASNTKPDSVKKNTQDKQALTSSTPLVNKSGIMQAPITAETQSITSTIKAFVDQQQYIFETLWNTAIPAEQKIKEMEEGIEPIKTEVLENPKEILKKIMDFNKTSNEICVFSSIGGMKLIYNNLMDLYREVVEKHRDGKHKGVRYLTSINNDDDVKLVKAFLDEGISIRHAKDMSDINFALSDSLLLSTIDKMEEGRMVATMLCSNDTVYVKHYRLFFENAWQASVDAKNRIKDIEEERYVNTKIVLNPQESFRLTNELFMLAKNEVLVILPSVNGLIYTEESGGFKFLDELASGSLKVKVLTVLDSTNSGTLNNIRSNYSHIEFRSLLFKFQVLNRITILDRKKTIVLEMKDNDQKKLVDVLGMAIFIESKTTALSYAAIFDSLWKQTDMYEQLKAAHEQLKIHDEIQKEFINTAAHELRTPIQPILGMTEFLIKSVKDSEHKDMLDVIIRNAHRLKKLSEDILDVARIESNSLHLNKEHFKIKGTILDIVNSYKNNADSKNIKFEHILNGDPTIYADKNGISQVISNLISNSIKFIPQKGGGEISILVRREKIKENNKDKEVVIVSVRDTGMGINGDISPKLFTKFGSNSFHGIGLGLYISKKIIESHGGNIWAKNNEDGKGAIFGFTLPAKD
jgi:two-component system, OmpR family, sensor histidine kinase VicK